MQIFQNKVIKKLKAFDYRQLTDMRYVGLAIVLLVTFSAVINGVQVVQKNYELLQKISVLEQENKIIELKNSNKLIQNEYFKTPEFAELKARKVNGKAAEGEKVYIVTKEAALKRINTPLEDAYDDTEPVIEAISKPKHQQNFEAWIDLFFGG